MSAILAHALAFARHGFETVQLWQPIEQNGRRICACRKGADCVSPGKHPYGPTAPNGLLSATTETGILKHWWSRYPELNLGVVIPPGVMVLDFDPRHGGELVEFEAEHGELPPSWRVQTGSGGWHCYFRLPDGVIVRGEKYNPQMPNKGTTFTGVDILTTGSYAVAPPSRHVSGRSYAWDVDHHPADVEIAAAPDWLIEKLALQSNAQPGGKSDDQWANILAGPIVKYPDAAACAIAGLALSRIRDVKTAWHFLRTWNAIAVQPPIAEPDLWKIFDRVADKERENATWQ